MNGSSAAPRGLYLITPDDPDTARLLRRVDAVLGAATWLQYRNKAAGAALRREQALALRARCAAAGVPLIVNDDLALARAVAADGVHLGEDDADPATARQALGAGALVGVSCYDDLERAARAAAAGASYLAFGAFHPTRSKITTRRADARLLRAAACWALPRVAIGGVTADNAAPLVAAGADLVAVIGAVFDAPDPPAAARALRQCFDAPAPP
ncbi:thiamine phosphate synthase [Luteimonas sp. RD2P54]|uniref:Thiamine-phosphate synthase n=1 Tax=Luteimonas endophytica TaxID=3042023 RepID=A0ABT6J7X7_9GAMM|nr:thiamine phosphate synthase [Luteimonas endophytica]MDH5822927.1 thiamine phosphate synthase [Luteimonas endophytica]